MHHALQQISMQARNISLGARDRGDGTRRCRKRVGGGVLWCRLDCRDAPVACPSCPPIYTPGKRPSLQLCVAPTLLDSSNTTLQPRPTIVQQSSNNRRVQPSGLHNNAGTSYIETPRRGERELAETCRQVNPVNPLGEHLFLAAERTTSKVY